MNEDIQQHILVFCCQLVEALVYLYCEAHVLHNDLKPVLCDTIGLSHAESSSNEIGLQIVLVDFGKATIISAGRRYYSEYTRCYPHITPEVTEGTE